MSRIKLPGGGDRAGVSRNKVELPGVGDRGCLLHIYGELLSVFEISLWACRLPHLIGSQFQ